MNLLGQRKEDILESKDRKRAELGIGLRCGGGGGYVDQMRLTYMHISSACFQSRRARQRPWSRRKTHVVVHYSQKRGCAAFCASYVFGYLYRQ